jgi:hypothetical protein
MMIDFVLLKTNAEGNCLDGRIIHLSRDDENEVSGRNPFSFNGSITISSLNRKSVLSSSIVNGYILEFLTDNQLAGIAAATTVAPSYFLPNVLVYAKRHTDGRGGSSLETMVNFQSLLSEVGGSNYGSNYYNPIYNYGGGSSGGNGSGNYNSSGPYRHTENAVAEPYSEPVLEKPVVVDFERVEHFPAIEIEKYLKCFASVPDNGATCSIEILADIPVDSDPNKLFNWQTESPGHTFIQIKKTNGSQSVVQNIGFYPVSNWKVTLTPAPIEGKIADNGEHEFNASLKMNLSSEDLKSVLNKIHYLSRFIKYDIDEYNCTDFALDVFNEVRTNKLTIPLYEIPGGMAAAGTSTPHGLYNQLKAMKKANGPEAANINIPGVKGWVAKSSGQCN